MKTQRRNFVVELKSGRKRTTLTTGSIWNGTDLKAIAREAESQSPHLFEPTGVPEPAKAVVDPALTINASSEPDGKKGSNDDTTSSRDAEIDQVHLEEGKVGLMADPISIVTALAGPMKPRVEFRTHTDAERPTGGRKDIAIDLPVFSVIQRQDDDLEFLDRENRRLKALWKKQLHEQNLRLQKMLERFDIS